MTSPKATKAERLQKLRARLERARDDNLQAVAEEAKCVAIAADTHTSKSGVRTEDKNEVTNVHVRKRKRPEKREETSVLTKSMRQRLERMEREIKATALPLGVDDDMNAHGASELAEPIQYGGAGRLKEGAADRVVAELEDLERRKLKYRRKPVFDEDNADIGFINDPNRKFNAILDQHYDKYDSVRTVKESLERGTALP